MLQQCLQGAVLSWAGCYPCAGESDGKELRLQGAAWTGGQPDMAWLSSLVPKAGVFTVTWEADRAQGMEILKVPLFTWLSKCRLEMPFLTVCSSYFELLDEVTLLISSKAKALNLFLLCSSGEKLPLHSSEEAQNLMGQSSGKTQSYREISRLLLKYIS